MDTPTPSARLSRRLLAAASVIFLSAGSSYAASLPVGGRVESGVASVTQTANSLTVQQSTSRLQMGWDSFNVAAGNSVTFQQPSSSSLAVNLVRGGDASVIAGSINANGRVVLINPQGIAFTGTSQVNVGSLVASALRDVAGDFADGKTVLSGSGADVINAGSITVAPGGSVVLAGSRVTNTGLILADAGRVAFAAGSQVSLDFAGDGLIRLSVDAGAVDAAVTNGGAVRVGSGHVLLTAKAADALASSVVRNSGELQASSVVERGGEIWLTADIVDHAGTVAATSGAGRGGEAHLVGAKSVSVTGTVDVTGATKGGFVDVSAPSVLLPDIFRINVGRGGHFLLDPDNIIIAAAGDPIVGSPVGSDPAADITLSSSSIETWLAGGSALTLDAVGNITVQSAISVATPGAGALTLDAGGAIDVQQPISTTGSLTLIAGGDVDVSATLNSASLAIFAGADLLVSENIVTTAGNLDFEVGGDLILDEIGAVLTLQSFGAVTPVVAGDILTNIPSALGGTEFVLLTDAGASVLAQGWLIAEDLGGASLLTLAGDVRMQYGFESGFSLPVAEDLAFVPMDGVKYPDLYAGQPDTNGLRVGDTLANAFDFPNLTHTWTAAAPTATSAAGATFDYTLGLGAGFDIKRPGYVVVLGETAGTLTVRPRELLVKSDDLAGTYGSAVIPSKYLYQITGYQFADTNVTLGITGEAVTSCDYNPADSLNRGAGDYPIAIVQGALAKSGAASANYEFNLVDGNYAIAKAPLNIQADDKTRIYGDANPAFTYAVVTGDLRYGETAGSVFTGVPDLSTVADPLSGVGSYAIDAGVGTLVNLSPNYDLVLTDAVLAVTKAPLTVTAEDATREYGQPNSDVVFTYAFSGFKNGENETTAGISGAAATTTTALVTSPIGDYGINVSNGTLLAANYDFTSFLPATLTVTRAPLTVTAQNATREYGLPNGGLNFTYVITGLRNGDPASVVTGSPTLSTAATQLSDVGAYAITVGAGTLTAANYDIGFLTNGVLTISPATSLVITANNQRRLYGDANPSLVGEYAITGFRNDDDVLSSGISGLATVTYAPAVTATSNVGNYNISIARGTLVDGVPGNYDLVAATYVPGALTIAKAPVSLVADSKSRTYGDANPTFTYSLAGLRNGETKASLTGSGALTGTPALATSATQVSNAGSYDITIGIGSLGATNYEFTTLTNGTLTVDKRALTVTANPQTREYGSADHQYAMGSEASYVIDGFLFSQTAAGLRLSGDLSGSPSMTTNAVVGSNVGGSYSVNIAKGTLDATNYDFDASSFVGAGYVITKAPISVTASDKSRIYGDPNPSLEYTLAGFKLGETTLGGIGATGLPVLATVADGLSNVGSYAVTVDVDAAPMSAANYRFIGIAGAITITKAPLTLKVDDAAAEYGSDFAGFSLTMAGFKNGQTQAGLRAAAALPTGNLSGDAVYTYANAAVKLLDVAGSPRPVVVTDIGTLTATNYDFVIQAPPAGTGQLTITPAPLTLKATGITRTYGDASLQSAVDDKWDVIGLKNGQTRDGLVTSGAITAAPSVASPLAIDTLTNAGSYVGAVTVSAGAFALSPTGNYSFDPVAVTTAADLKVDKAPVVVGVLGTPLTKVYGDALPSLLPSYAGLKNGQTGATAGLVGAPAITSVATASSNVGSYGVAVDVSGLSAPNYAFTKVDGTLDVTKASLTVSADAKTREYGLSNPTLTATLTGFKLGQALGTSGVTGSAALGTTALPTSGIGSYPVTVALGTLASSNYQFTAFNDSTLTITRAPLTISADPKTKVYGDANPTLTYSVVGLRQVDTAAVILGGLPTLSTAIDRLTGAGAYTGAISADIAGLSADNYTIGKTAGTFTVQKATLVGTVEDAVRTFGFANPTFTVTWTGFKNADTAATAGFTGALAFSTDANPASPVAGSPYPVNAATGTYVSPNYAFGTVVPGLLVVERGNLWENEAYNLAAAPLAAAIRLEDIQARLRGKPLSGDPQALIDFDKYAVRLRLSPPDDKDKPRKDEAVPVAPAPGSISKN